VNLRAKHSLGRCDQAHGAELGGKDAICRGQEADLDAAAEGTAKPLLDIRPEVFACSGASWPEKVYDTFVQKLS